MGALENAGKSWLDITSADRRNEVLVALYELEKKLADKGLDGEGLTDFEATATKPLTDLVVNPAANAAVRNVRALVAAAVGLAKLEKYALQAEPRTKSGTGEAASYERLQNEQALREAIADFIRPSLTDAQKYDLDYQRNADKWLSVPLDSVKDAAGNPKRPEPSNAICAAVDEWWSDLAMGQRHAKPTHGIGA